MNSTIHERRLPNGLRVVCESMPRVRSAAIGFFVNTGSRNESAAEHGVSHFLEHMCFKGTATRDWRAINVRFDELGSIYNAFTSKEHTVYFGWTPADRVEGQLELLADMMRPVLPPEDYETERKVILEEIAMSGDSFEHHVWNFLHETCFPGHALAHEILGEKQTIENLPREMMLEYRDRRYAPGNMTLTAAGAIDAEEFFRLAERYTAGWRPGDATHGERAPVPPLPTGQRGHQLEQFKQQTVMFVVPSVPRDDPQSESIEAFVGLFGGANSRCYWNIIQKGVCSNAGAAWLSYADTGLMVLWADGEPQRCEDMLAALQAQAKEVVEGGFREDEIQRVKNRRRTQLALEAESPKTRLMQLIDDVETHGGPRTPAQRLAAVEAVSARSIAHYLERFPITGDGLLMSCGPRQWP